MPPTVTDSLYRYNLGMLYINYHIDFNIILNIITFFEFGNSEVLEMSY